jgi:predicted nucleic acid-binding protein
MSSSSGLLLDSNVFSELRKRGRADSRVLSWFAGVDEAEVHTSLLVLGEIRRGIYLVERRDPVGGLHLRAWLDELVAGLGSRVLGLDAETIEIWARINTPNALPAIDGLIAATALRHRLTLVTRNVVDIERSGVQVFNPWADP